MTKTDFGTSFLDDNNRIYLQFCPECGCIYKGTEKEWNDFFKDDKYECRCHHCFSKLENPVLEHKEWLKEWYENENS